MSGKAAISGIGIMTNSIPLFSQAALYFFILTPSENSSDCEISDMI
jgi:hypothetical protein